MQREFTSSVKTGANSERQQTPQGRAQLRERVAVEHTLAHIGGKDGALGIADCARTSSIYSGVPLFTICTSWPVPSRFKPIFRMQLEFLTEALVGKQASEASLLARGSNSLPEMPPAYLSNFETVTIPNVHILCHTLAQCDIVFMIGDFCLRE
jgi:hypothetical protein